MRVYQCDSCGAITKKADYITFYESDGNISQKYKKYDLCEDCMITIEKILTQNGTWIANEKI